MNDNLSCALVRDLLPSYVDRLTSEETNHAIDRHLAGCEGCQEALRLMKGSQPAEAKPAEVDYLKKVRRRGICRSLLVGAALVCLSLALFVFCFFYLGQEAPASDLLWDVAVEGNTLHLSGTVASSGLGVSRVTFSERDGGLTATVYTAPKTFFNQGEFSASYTPPAPIRQVRIGDMVLWEEGETIHPTAAKLFAAVNPHLGDMPANTKIAEILGIFQQFGPYTNELQTAKEPYGWTIVLDTSLPAADEDRAQEAMAVDSCAMLATVRNLGYVSWRYPTDAGTQTYTVTAEDASALVGQDIKSYGESARGLQSLVEILKIK